MEEERTNLTCVYEGSTFGYQYDSERLTTVDASRHRTNMTHDADQIDQPSIIEKPKEHPPEPRP